MAKGNKLDLAPSKKDRFGVGQCVLAIILLIYTLFCFLPVLLVFIAAFTDEKYITQNGFSFFPKKLSMVGFNTVLRYGSQLAKSYGVTIFITVAGTFLGLLVMSMSADGISKHTHNKKSKEGTCYCYKYCYSIRFCQL